MPTDLIALLSPQNLIIFVVVLTRLTGMMSTAPLLATYPIPVQIKVWFMAMVAFVMFPMVLAKVGFQMPTNIPELTIIMIKEFMIGYIVAPKSSFVNRKTPSIKFYTTFYATIISI